MSDGPARLDLKVKGAVDSREEVYIIRPSDREVFGPPDAERVLQHPLLASDGQDEPAAPHEGAPGQGGGENIASIDVAGYLGFARDADHWYRGLLQRHRGVNYTPARCEGMVENCPRPRPTRGSSEFFRTEVDARDDARVVIFLDEIDGTLKLPYTDDFFVAVPRDVQRAGPRCQPSSNRLLLARCHHAERAN